MTFFQSNENEWAMDPPQGNDDNIFEFLDLHAIDYGYLAPSTTDDRSTTGGSELDVPALTFNRTSTGSKASRSVGAPEDAERHHGLSPSQPSKSQGGGDFSPVDNSSFLFLGHNPEIQVHESLSPPPKRICLDDSSIDLSPTSPPSRAGLPPLLTAPAVRRAGSCSERRGRRSPLPTDKRAKVSSMRKTKACSWCHIHKVEVRIPMLINV